MLHAKVKKAPGREQVVFVALAISIFLNLTSVTLPFCSPETATSREVHEDEYHDVTLLRIQAEQAWLDGRGYMWLQHARKAGGTTLCMMMRQNTLGLVQMNHTEIATHRATCQIKDFCFNCNVKEKYNVTELPGGALAALQRNERNLIEMEGSGVPLDLLTSGAWDKYVFVSSIRHPLPRIVSSLLYDGKTACKKRGDQAGQCMAEYLDNETIIIARCERWLFNCHHNYFVRMFSGLDNSYTNDDDMLERAKQNFKRFSCVVLQERWDDTTICLRRLGLFIRNKMHFNVNGELHDIDGNTSSESRTRLSMIPDEAARERLVEMNRVDLEFYEWAKEQILSPIASESPYLPRI